MQTYRNTFNPGLTIAWIHPISNERNIATLINFKKPDFADRKAPTQSNIIMTKSKKMQILLIFSEKDTNLNSLRSITKKKKRKKNELIFSKFFNKCSASYLYIFYNYYYICKIIQKQDKKSYF